MAMEAVRLSRRTFCYRLRSDSCVFCRSQIPMSILKEKPEVNSMWIVGHLILMIDPFIVVMNELRFQKVIMFMIVTFDNASCDKLPETVID